MRSIFGPRSLSDGYLAKTNAAVSEKLAPAYNGLREEIRRKSCINIDETGHKDRKEKHWTWAFRTADFALSHIDKSRDAQYDGTIGNDYWGAYKKNIRENGANINREELLEACFRR